MMFVFFRKLDFESIKVNFDMVEFRGLDDLGVDFILTSLIYEYEIHY